MKGILFTILTILWGSSAWAQGKMDFYEDVFNVLNDKLLPRLIDSLPSSERKQLTGVELELIRNPAVVTAVFTGKNTKKIHIFVGFMDGLFQYIDCLLMTKNKAEGEGCYRYFDYYFDHIVSKKSDPPVAFAEFTLVEDAKIDAWYDDKRVDRARKTVFLSALIYIVMHEMGHHIIGFAQPGMTVAQHRDLETRADQWAIDRLAQRNENPVLGAVGAFGYLSQMEKFRRIKGVRHFSLHPMPRVRAHYAYKKGCANVAENMAARACDMFGEIINTFE